MASRARGAARRGPASSPVSALLHKLGPDKSALDCAKVFADAIGNGNLGQGAARAAVPTLAELHATAVPFIAGSGPEPEHKPPSKALIYRRAILVGKLSTKEGCMQLTDQTGTVACFLANPDPSFAGRTVAFRHWSCHIDQTQRKDTPPRAAVEADCVGAVTLDGPESHSVDTATGHSVQSLLTAAAGLGRDANVSLRATAVAVSPALPRRNARGAATICALAEFSDAKANNGQADKGVLHVMFVGRAMRFASLLTPRREYIVSCLKRRTLSSGSGTHVRKWTVFATTNQTTVTVADSSGEPQTVPKPLGSTSSSLDYSGVITRQISDLVFQLDNALPLILTRHFMHCLSYGLALRPGARVHIYNAEPVRGPGGCVVAISCCARSTVSIAGISARRSTARPFDPTLSPFWPYLRGRAPEDAEYFLYTFAQIRKKIGLRTSEFKAAIGPAPGRSTRRVGRKPHREPVRKRQRGAPDQGSGISAILASATGTAPSDEPAVSQFLSQRDRSDARADEKSRLDRPLIPTLADLCEAARTAARAVESPGIPGESPNRVVHGCVLRSDRAWLPVLRSLSQRRGKRSNARATGVLIGHLTRASYQSGGHDDSSNSNSSSDGDPPHLSLVDRTGRVRLLVNGSRGRVWAMAGKPVVIKRFNVCVDLIGSEDSICVACDAENVRALLPQPDRVRGSSGHQPMKISTRCCARLGSNCEVKSCWVTPEPRPIPADNDHICIAIEAISAPRLLRRGGGSVRRWAVVAHGHWWTSTSSRPSDTAVDDKRRGVFVFGSGMEPLWGLEVSPGVTLRAYGALPVAVKPDDGIWYLEFDRNLSKTDTDCCSDASPALVLSTAALNGVVARREWANHRSDSGADAPREWVLSVARGADAKNAIISFSFHAKAPPVGLLPGARVVVMGAARDAQSEKDPVELYKAGQLACISVTSRPEQATVAAAAAAVAAMESKNVAKPPPNRSLCEFSHVNATSEDTAVVARVVRVVRVLMKYVCVLCGADMGPACADCAKGCFSSARAPSGLEQPSVRFAAQAVCMIDDGTGQALVTASGDVIWPLLQMPPHMARAAQDIIRTIGCTVYSYELPGAAGSSDSGSTPALDAPTQTAKLFSQFRAAGSGGAGLIRVLCQQRVRAGTPKNLLDAARSMQMHSFKLGGGRNMTHRTVKPLIFLRASDAQAVSTSFEAHRLLDALRNGRDQSV